MDELQQTQLIDVVVVVHAYDEVQRCVSSVDDLVLPVLEETALIFCPTKALPYELSLESDPLPDCERIEVFC